MKIFIEGEKYPLEILKQTFQDSKFYIQNDEFGVLQFVGYYHSFSNNEVVYMLPKVFMENGIDTVFGISKYELLNVKCNNFFKHKNEYNWVRQICVYFYNSLLEFKKRNSKSTILQKSSVVSLNKSLGKVEYSYLDLLLSFTNFYLKNKDVIFFKQIEIKSKQFKKTNWPRTISKELPLCNNNNQPIYVKNAEKIRVRNTEEELIVYFFSILNHFNIEHHLYLNIDKSYNLHIGNQFENLQKNGLSKLRKIKYRYFNDILIKMYYLCELYFSITDTASSRKLKEEFIAINNYNIVFEDMVDKLFSDPIIKNHNNGFSLENLKFNEDGKIIDHIFDFQSLIDTSNIFYIGDSKYYKPNSSASKISQYKQFTYSKNIIQYNIDLLNEGKDYKSNIRYRDNLTEGYNITPNFFIFGYIDDYKDFDNSNLKEKGNVLKSFHFEERLFDRDTLFVLQYQINFLFVLKSYTFSGISFNNTFRDKAKHQFRSSFLSFFKNMEYCEFELFEYNNDNIESFVEEHFRILNGKCYLTNQNKLIVAKHSKDNTLNDIIRNCKKWSFS